MLDFAWYLQDNLGQYTDDNHAHFNGVYLNKWITKNLKYERKNSSLRTNNYDSDRSTKCVPSIFRIN